MSNEINGWPKSALQMLQDKSLPQYKWMLRARGDMQKRMRQQFKGFPSK